jgi:hypothetical protein
MFIEGFQGGIEPGGSTGYIGNADTAIIESLGIDDVAI